MRMYYHFYPACPDCHEPFVKGSPLEMEYLFELSLSCKNYLEDGLIESELKEGFENNKYPLSDNAIISTIDEKTWEIIDSSKSYVMVDNGRKLKIYDTKNLKCSCCDAHFHSTIDLSSSDRFANIAEAVINTEGEQAEKYLSDIPLVWKIKPNQIEDEYIRWVRRTSRGKFLITWPWEEVKFIPLLVSEYLLNDPEKKVVVVCNLSSVFFTEAEITAPTVKEVFDHMIYLDEEGWNNIDERIGPEIKKLDHSVLKREKVIRYEIHRIGKHIHYYTGGICDQKFKKCLKELVDGIEADYGGGSIRKVYERKMSGRHTENSRSENGFIDIELKEREEWTGKLHYKKAWLRDVLLNSRRIKRPSRIISNTVLIEAEEEIQDRSDKRLFLSHVI